MKSWTPEEKVQARKALMDKYVHNRTESETENLGLLACSG